MSNLNSVLLDGIVLSEVDIFTDENVKRCSFMLHSINYGKNEENGESVAESESCVLLSLSDPIQVETAVKNIKPGCRLRVVGQLVGLNDNLYIAVEHIQYLG
jgi:hypothetical protein